MNTAVRPRPAVETRMRARRALVRADRARRRQRRTMSVAVLLLLIAGGVAVARSSLFAITQVEVLGSNRARARTVMRAAAIEVGENLLVADLSGARERVERLPWVRSVDIVRVPPSKVAVRIVERQPVVVLRTGGASWLVDDEAVLVAGGDTDDLPPVQVPDVSLPEVGERVTNEGVRNAIAVHISLPTWLRERVLGYEASSESVRFEIEGPDGETVGVRFGRAVAIAQKSEVIRALLRQTTTQVGALDVRAPANPVVVPGSQATGDG